MNQVICKNDYDLLTSRDFYPDLSHSKANHLILGLCPAIPQNFTKIWSATFSNPVNRQIDKQRQRHALAEVINQFTIKNI